MKFINLLKKELAELVNKNMLLGLVVTVAIFMILGGIMKTTINDVVDESKNVTIKSAWISLLGFPLSSKTSLTLPTSSVLKSTRYSTDSDSSANSTSSTPKRSMRG